MIRDQIVGEAHQVHAQLGRMMQILEQRELLNQCPRAQAEQSMQIEQQAQQAQSAQPAQPVQPPPAPPARTSAPLQVKPAPISRPQAQPSSSAMSGAPVNAQFPPGQQGADPWM